MSGTPPEIERRAPQPGEHNNEIYGKLLGYSDKEILAFQKQGAI
jgi:crotonobetainyl-CoA:carnitine CoA-transferase CaiB-like acyl-CoA transferase